MDHAFSRTERMLGSSAMEKLQNAKVAIFGLGGVGSYTAEALVRGGIGRFLLVDGDCVDETNLNRQLIATRDTIGLPKVIAERNRMLSINPQVAVEPFELFYDADHADHLDCTDVTYIVDAIDTVTAKLLLIERAHAQHISIISCMGAGNKLDPTQFEVADIYSTSVCPLARVMRRELKARKIPSLKVVYSREPAIRPASADDQEARIPGSVSFVPAAAGLILAGEVIKDIIGWEAGE